MKWIVDLFSRTSFQEQLVVGILLGLLGFWIGPIYLDWRNRPQVSLEFNKADENISCQTSDVKEYNLESSQGAPNCWEGNFVLNIKNEGSRAVKDFYYTILFPKELKVEVPAANPILQVSGLIPKEFSIGSKNDQTETEVSGFVTMPVYSGRTFAFPHLIYVKTCQQGSYIVNYFFVTDQGLSPSGLTRTAYLEKGKMGSLKINTCDLK